MLKLLIGSAAFKEHVPNSTRKVRDMDFLTSPDAPPLPKTLNGLKVENFTHKDLENYDWVNPTGTATLDELYTIKISHMFWVLKNGSWDKHFNDVLLFQYRTDAKFIPELYDVLYPIWEEKHGRKPANLNQQPEDFFNNNVARIYEHDSIHASVAYYDEPLFNRILKDGAPVAVDKNKFYALPELDKKRLVFEEVYATALERQVIPANYSAEVSYLEAYRWAFVKLITSFAKGWFPLWVLLNAKDLYRPELNFVKTHLANKHKLVLLPAGEDK